jgi:Ca2+-binding RTX toxin-like protein
VTGGDGNDTLDPGPGGDNVRGELGDDTILGNSGGDRMYGGPGNDRLYGELQDDYMYGEEGDDLLVGDQGIDAIEGGPGADWMRGGTNQDSYDGGSGSDTVSFTTATPPGPTPSITGVYVDLPAGRIKGDGGEDRVRGTENVVGSAYDDLLKGMGAGTADGVVGNDDCEGFDQLLGCFTPGGTASGLLNWTHVRLEEGPDPGVIVVPKKGAANETIRVSESSAGITVTGTGPFSTGGSCDVIGVDDSVFCPDPEAPLGYIAAFGGDGNDRISIGGGIPLTTTVDLDGGNGNDRLEGSGNNDTLYAGEFGEDVLIGNGGGDALISEVGRDILIGGPGNDNLVTAAPCSGHIFDGGTGAADVAGFGRTYYNGVVARLGGTAIERGKKGCKPTTIRKNHEVLEGTRNNDILYARRKKDLLIGREGRDRCVGGKHRTC